MPDDAPRCPFDPRDPFRAAREAKGVHYVHAEGQDVPLVLRLQNLRKTCKDWKTFSNDDPLMIVLHSEANVRDVRQLPIETDPPDHTDYRALVEPIFRQPQQPEYIADMQALVARCVAEALETGELEAVRQFALPLQSRGLTRLLGMPESEADVWIGWGTHVYHDGDNHAEKGSQLDTYFRNAFARAQAEPGDDFFSKLNTLEFRGRPLTKDEKHGFAHMTFAGGRDTVIHTVSSILAHLAEHPEVLPVLRENPDRILTATEEYVRWVSPLTAIARRCPAGAELPGTGTPVPERGRVGLCWPSANRDESVFKNPGEVVLDRAPNPHIGFGFGAHNCLGQHQARLIIRSLLSELATQADRLELLDATPQVETESSYERQVGYTSLRLRFHPRSTA